MKRIISSVLAACLILSVTACNNGSTGSTNRTTKSGETQDVVESSDIEPDKTTETSAEDAVAATDQSGKYTYTVYAGTEYETTLSMDVNIDDYVLNVEGKKVPFFSIGNLWKDLGWQEKTDPKWTGLTYASYMYDDSQMVWRYGDCYSNNDNPAGYEQLCSFMYHKAPLDNYEASANPSSGNDPLKYGIYVTFSQHSEDLCYYTFFPGSTAAISRDDAIIIAYVLSSAISRPGENPFVGTNLEKAQWQSSGDYLSYLLP